MIPWNDTKPLGATTAERTYWKVGNGQPEPGSRLGYDLRWLDAEGNVVGERIINTDGKTPIDKAEYDALIPAWNALGQG